MLQEIIERRLWVVYQFYNRIDDFTQIVRWNVCRHTDSNTDLTVEQQVRQFCRQYDGLLLRTIKVITEINRVFVDIDKQLVRGFAHTRFGVTHGSSWVAVHRTKVTLPLDQHIAH